MQHNAIYAALIAAITPDQTFAGGELTLNPYEVAPLSAVYGYYSDSSAQSVTVSVEDASNPATLISHTYLVEGPAAPTLLPVLGLCPDVLNIVRIKFDAGPSVDIAIRTAPLPPSDTQTGGDHGFPVVTLQVPPTDAAKLYEGLYFVALQAINNIAFDATGLIRWFTTKGVPSLNTVRISDGTFLATDPTVNLMLDIWKFEMSGRVVAVYRLSEAAHHSIMELDDGTILYPSENLLLRTEAEKPDDDCIAVMRLSDGQEEYFYDMTTILDFSRFPRPYDTTREGTYDWCHINQAYIDSGTNLMVASSRHQGAVFGFDRVTGELGFIVGTHADWSSPFIQYLLQPVDADGNALYDLTDPAQAAQADREFWNWGQHHPLEIVTGDPNFIEFVVFDNGNFRSRDDTKTVIANDNISYCIRFRVDLLNMTVQMIDRYGETIGHRGYSSLVGTKFYLPNGNLLANFGGVNVDNTGRYLTRQENFTDPPDPGITGTSYTGYALVQELNFNTKEVFIEFVVGSGSYKPMVELRDDAFSFRTYKLPLYP